MKTKVINLAIIFSVFALSATAQQVEYDDMYFNSKERAKLRAQKSSEMSFTASSKKQKAQEEALFINPTDSYSARNINPEFAARSNAQAAQQDEQNYFDNSYQYNTASNFNGWNNNFNNWYNSPWYGANYFGPSINAWNSPYYGSAFDMWGSPWGNPHFQSGWGSSFSYHWGSNWNYGWGNSFGMGFNPYNNWARNTWGPSFGHGFGGGWYGNAGWYGNNWGHSNVIIVNNGGEAGRGVAYGKRGTRGGAVVSDNNYTNNGSRTRSTTNVATPNEAYQGGRVAAPANTRNQSQSEYYNRSWRNTADGNTRQQSTYPTRSSSNNSWNNVNNNNSNSRSSSYNSNSRSSSFDNSRSSSPSPSYSSPSRGSGGSPASGGSGGRSRGRD